MLKHYGCRSLVSLYSVSILLWKLATLQDLKASETIQNISRLHLTPSFPLSVINTDMSVQWDPAAHCWWIGPLSWNSAPSVFVHLPSLFFYEDSLKSQGIYKYFSSVSVTVSPPRHAPCVNIVFTAHWHSQHSFGSVRNKEKFFQKRMRLCLATYRCGWWCKKSSVWQETWMWIYEGEENDSMNHLLARGGSVKRYMVHLKTF